MEDSSHVSGENMRDLTSQGANSDENNDEEKPLDPDYVEERFRVDRRKLEHMIQAAVGKAQNAEDFFIEIMDVTSTQITWPSKLKIGAKSKKDPHIKVSGHKDAVAGAKEKIMAVLDTKSTRVTLKMDVSHTEHSHVIGKGGNNIKRVMHDTGCHIHFPDSNRNNQSEKSNQVSIAGQPQGVENAREKIRELLPLVFMFELQISIPPDSSSPTVQQIQSNYGVTVTFKQRPRSYNTMVIIRGSVNNAKAVKEATLLMMEQLTGGNQTYVSMQLEIAPQHHQFIIGTAYANIKQIMQRTGATIHFPDHTTVNPQRKGTVYITGPIDNVFLARNSLIGCLPLVLMFDMKEDVEIDQGNMSQLMEQLDVFISIKPKPKQPSKSVIVKSIERNAANLYEARRRLLGGNEESVSVNNATDSYTSLGGLQDLSLLGQNLVNMNANPVVMINRLQSPNPVYGSPVVVFSPRIATIPSQYLQAQNGLNNAELLQQQSALLHLAASTERVASGNTSGSDSPHGSPASCTSPPVDLAASSAAVVPNVSALLAGKSTDSLFSANHRLPNYHGNHVLPATTQGLQATKRDISAAAAVAAAAQLQTTLSGGQAAGPPGLPASVQNRLLYEQAAAGLLGSSGLSSPGTGAQGNGLNASGIQRNGLGADLNGDIQRQTMVGGDMSQVSIQEMLYRQSALNAEKRMSSLVDDAKLISRGSEVRRSSLGGDLPRSRLEMDAAPRQNIRDMKRPSLGAELERSLPVSLPQQMNFGTSLSAAAEIPSGHPSLPPGLGLGAADDIGLARNSPDDIAAALQATLASPTFSRSNLGVSELGRFNASLMASAGAQTSHNFNHNDMSPLSKMQGSSSFADSMFQRRLSPSSSSSDLFGSGHRAGSPHKTSPLGSPHTMPSSPAIKHRALLLEENGRNFPFQNGTEGRSSESGCDSDGSDHNRAPGSNRPWKGDPHSIFLADGMSVYDYEQKKLMATKAMQKKPDGESRIPTDYWAGLGFSKSMPDSAIRERLKQSNVRYNGPSMTTTFEESGDELQSPVQRDFPISPLPHRVANAGRDSPATPPLQRESQHPLSAVPGELPPHRKIVGEFGMASSNHMDGSSIGAGSSGWPPKTDLAELFSQIGLGKYTDLFTQQEIDLATFLTLTDQDLKELGISTFGARRKMILAIQEYNKRPALLSVAPGSNNPFRDTSSSSMMSRRRDIASVSGRW